MTDISVYTQPFQAEDLTWDRTEPDQGYDGDGIVLDVSLFTQAQHYPNGYIPSGCVLGKVTATGRYGPYLDAASDGRQTAAGFLKASVAVVQPNGAVKSRVGAAMRRAFCAIAQGRLPFTSGNAAAGGYLDAAGKVDLPLNYYDA